MRYLITALLALTLGSAATTSEARTKPRTQISIAAPFDSVWAAVDARLAELPRTDVDRNRGVIETGFTPLELDSLRQVALGMRCTFCRWRRGRYSVRVDVAARGASRTQLRIACSIEGLNSSRDAQWNGWRHLESRGVLEAQLIAEVVARLQ